MATTPVTYSNQGPRITVNSLIKDPLLIRQRFLRMADKEFIMEALLRNVGQTQSGVIQYEESAPMFLDDDMAVVAEAGEIPAGQGSEGLWKAAATIKLARGIIVTQEQRDRNRMDLVNRRMDQVKNTMLRAWERRLFTMFSTHPSIPTISTAGDPWTGAAPLIRKDIILAKQAVEEAVSPTTGNTDDFLGFEPDTLVVSRNVAYTMTLDPAFIDIYKSSPLVTKSPIYTGQLEREVEGLTIMTSRFLPDTYAYVMQRNVIGGYSDERSLFVSPLKRNDDNETWRSNVVRRTGMFLDQPLAAAKIAITV
jgi:hypothetical protein